MSERICCMCGNVATGFASGWTRETGDRPYCHGDNDLEPTCYERVGRPSALQIFDDLLADLNQPTAEET